MRHLQIHTMETKASPMDWLLTGVFNGLLVEEVVGMDGGFETPLSLRFWLGFEILAWVGRIPEV